MILDNVCMCVRNIYVIIIIGVRTACMYDGCNVLLLFAKSSPYTTAEKSLRPAAAAGALSDRARQLFPRELWSTVGGDDIVAQR